MTRRTIHNLAALVCFGPITISLIPLGLLLLPVWVSSLGNQLAGNPVNVHYGPEETIWTTVLPIALLLSGLAGLIGLLRVLRIVNSQHRPVRGRRLTLLLIACGVLSIVILNRGFVDPFRNMMAAMIYWILPLCGTVYFLYVSRKALFSTGDTVN